MEKDRTKGKDRKRKNLEKEISKKPVEKQECLQEDPLTIALKNAELNKQKRNLDTGKYLKKIIKGKEDVQEETKEQHPLRKRKASERSEEEQKRRIFIGNVNRKCSYRGSSEYWEMKKHFSKYGKVENMSFHMLTNVYKRNPGDKNMLIINSETKKLARDLPVSCYMTYENQESADKALEAHGKVLFDRHIIVDRSEEVKRLNKKKTVFIGNINYSVSEENIWNYFDEKLGKCVVNNVRLIKNPSAFKAMTNARETYGVYNKGFAYVEFKDIRYKQKALKMFENTKKIKNHKEKSLEVKYLKGRVPRVSTYKKIKK